MELNAKQEEFKIDLAKAMERAWEDESFKKQLLASPKEAIESITGRKLNLKEDINLVVTDQSKPNTFYLNLASKPDMENVELNEEQLELVAGGTCSFFRPIDCALELAEAAIVAGVVIALETGLIE